MTTAAGAASPGVVASNLVQAERQGSLQILRLIGPSAADNAARLPNDAILTASIYHSTRLSSVDPRERPAGVVSTAYMHNIVLIL